MKPLKFKAARRTGSGEAMSHREYTSASLRRSTKGAPLSVWAEWWDGDWTCGGLIFKAYPVDGQIVVVSPLSDLPIAIVQDEAALLRWVKQKIGVEVKQP